MSALKITTRDRIFAALAIPVALVAAYARFAHAPLEARVASMRGRLAELGDAGDLKARRPALEQRRDKARALREKAERAEADRLGATNGAGAGDDAGRLQRFAAILGEAGGLRITATERLDGGDGIAARLVCEATGVQSPSLWRFTVVSDYAGVLRALGIAGQRSVPAIVEGVTLDGATGRPASRIWKIDVRL